MNPYLIVAFLVAVLAAGAGGFKLGADHEVASQARADEQLQKAEEKMTKAAADAIAQLRPKYTTIQGKLEKQIETNTVYRDCKLDPIGLSLVNQALTGGTEAPASGKLPPVDKAGE